MEPLDKVRVQSVGESCWHTCRYSKSSHAAQCEGGACPCWCVYVCVYACGRHV